ncbi:MAG TPA: DUF3108 domain-containing protein [Clostridia bacterium]|nr:DUF3108 domain-containing protein [Clostridia bacterium]
MKRYALLILILIIIFAFTGCGSSLEFATLTEPIPSAENYVFNIKKNVDNSLKETGTAEYSVTSDSYSLIGKPAYKITATIVSEQHTTTITSYLASEDTGFPVMTPLFTQKEYKPSGDEFKPWKLTAEYDNEKRTCTIKAEYSVSENTPKTEQVSFELKDTYLDNETLVLAVRSIKLTPGYTGLLNVIVPQYGKSEPVRIKVADETEKINTPSGSFDCYKVTIKANTIFATDVTATVCYIAVDDKRVVRIEQGPYLYELAEYSAQ